MRQAWKTSLVSLAGIAAVAHGGQGSVNPAQREQTPALAQPLASALSVPVADATHAGTTRQAAPLAERRHRMNAPSVAAAVPRQIASQPAIVSAPADVAAVKAALPSAAAIAATPPASQLAPVRERPAAAPAAASGMARIRQDISLADGDTLHRPDAALVAQIDPAEARRYFERLGVTPPPGTDGALGEFDFSQVERFARPELARPDYAEVIEDPAAPGGMIVRTAAAKAGSSRAAAPEQSGPAATPHNDKSPVGNPPQTGGSAEFE